MRQNAGHAGLRMSHVPLLKFLPLSRAGLRLPRNHSVWRLLRACAHGAGGHAARDRVHARIRPTWTACGYRMAGCGTSRAPVRTAPVAMPRVTKCMLAGTPVSVSSSPVSAAAGASVMNTTSARGS